MICSKCRRPGEYDRECFQCHQPLCDSCYGEWGHCGHQWAAGLVHRFGRPDLDIEPEEEIDSEQNTIIFTED